jgi:transcription initiation factor TFIIB
MRMAKKEKDKMQKKDAGARAHPARTIPKEEAEVEGPAHALGRELGADLGIVHGEGGPKVIESVKHCPSCGSRDIIFDSERGEYVCNGCGLVIEENVTDTGPEWRAFDTDQRNARARTGAPIKYMKPNKGLVTEIDMYNKDIRGAKLPSKRQAQLYRIRKWHKRASIASSSERNYLVALPELNRVASYLGLPDNVRESAALLYRNCVKNNLIRGRPIETVVNAALYATCRQAGMPRTLDEISQISGVPKKEIGRTYRVVAHELHLKIPLTDPIAYVPRYVAALKLSGEAQEKSVLLLKQAMKKGLVSGRSPTGVSAAAVYIASALVGERRTQKEVAEVAGVTEVTIRNRYRELKKELNIDVNL